MLLEEDEEDEEDTDMFCVMTKLHMVHLEVGVRLTKVHLGHMMLCIIQCVPVL